MSESWVQTKDLIAVFLFLLTFVGAFVGVALYISGRFERLREQIDASAERRGRERAEALARVETDLRAEQAQIWREIKEIERNFVRRDDLDGHLGRIDRNVGELRDEMRKNTEAVAGLTKAVIAALGAAKQAVD